VGNRFPPGFTASLVGAAAGFLGGALLTGILAWPFALASWSTLAVGGGSEEEFAVRLLVVVFLLVGLQLLVSAWIAQQAASLLGDGAVRYRRALGALALGAVANPGRRWDPSRRRRPAGPGVLMGRNRAGSLGDLLGPAGFGAR
jgi:hypothetical protein